MSILGSYLTVEVDGAVVAETTDVSIKMKAKALDTTTKDSGLNSTYMGGTVNIAIAGSYLFASDAANWTLLWDKFNGGDKVTLSYLCNGVCYLTGDGLIKVLSMKGGDSGTLVTGTYGIKHQTTYAPIEILTEAGVEITTEDGETLITE